LRAETTRRATCTTLLLLLVVVVVARLNIILPTGSGPLKQLGTSLAGHTVQTLS
jgi:hypothetical protein